MIFIVFIVILLLLGVVINEIFSSFYTRKAHEEANQLATHMTRMLQEQKGARVDLIGTMAEFSGVDIFLVNPDGKFAEPTDGHQYARPEDFPNIWDNTRLMDGQMVEKEFTSGNKLYLLHGKPIMDENNHFTGGVYVVSSLESMKESIRSVRNLLLFSGLGALLLAVGLIFILSKKISNPLLQIMAATRKIAKGELNTRVTVTSKDEIGSLSAAINDLARELQRYRDSRSEFFANISHELRTPITYLEGYADVLAKGLIEDEAEKQKYLNILSQEARRLTYIIQDLFDLAKMEEGKIDLHLETVDPAEILESSIHKVELKAKEKGLEIGSRLEQVHPIQIDRIRCEQILLNLLDNAIRYTLQGSITVTLSQKGKFVIFEIADSGPGIPEEELPYIFERFYRVEKSRSRQFGGTGLGLSIVQKLVELQGGSIEVKSVVGQGTAFIISFESKDI
jgi:signal transduction histidine kinase